MGSPLSNLLISESVILVQEAFLKIREKSVTKNDKTVSDINVGWYSRDDMAKILHWAPNLTYI